MASWTGSSSPLPRRTPWLPRSMTWTTLRPRCLVWSPAFGNGSAGELPRTAQGGEDQATTPLTLSCV
eukprot:8939177-Prorocentrum_lima.AAC.1